jgi:hypothetical protein
LTACWQESYAGGSKAKLILLPVRHLREWIELNIFLELANGTSLERGCNACALRELAVRGVT